MLASDSELLGRHCYANDAKALEALVRRHSGLVMNVCRTMLMNRDDAEDAFQATFLVLSRKADSLIHRNSIAGWLYHVAVRNCLAARRLQRRNSGEPLMTNDPVSEENEPWLSIAQVQEFELLHREIDRLPKQYRDAIVICHLQGHSRNEAAELLDRSEASIKAALARGRNLLRKRLLRSGLMTTAMLVSISNETHAANAAVTDSLIRQTITHCRRTEIGASVPISSSIQTIAQSGANMTINLFTKSLLFTVGLTLMCLPLLVLAKTNQESNSSASSTVQSTDDLNKKTSIELPPVEIGKSEEDEAPAAVDPRKFDINHSEEYWKLIKKSLEFRQSQLEASLQRNKEYVRNRSEVDRSLDLQSQIFETRAKIVEADLNINRIRQSEFGRSFIDPRRIPPASTTDLRPGEVLELKSFVDHSLNDSRIVVQADHTISLALVGTIKVKGMNPGELQVELTKAYSRFVNDPSLFLRRLSAFDSDRAIRRHSEP